MAVALVAVPAHTPGGGQKTALKLIDGAIQVRNQENQVRVNICLFLTHAELNQFTSTLEELRGRWTAEENQQSVRDASTQQHICPATRETGTEDRQERPLENLSNAASP